jgi:hypothetical protein
VDSLSVTFTFDGAPISRTAKVADSSLLNVHHVAFLQFSYLGYRRVVQRVFGLFRFNSATKWEFRYLIRLFSQCGSP